MTMQTYEPTVPPIPNPLCCDQPMRIRSAEFSPRERKIVFYCKSCGGQVTESSVDLQS